MPGILLEGVTGSGKTQTLRALMRHPEFPSLLGSGHIVTEDQTFGEVMDELDQPGRTDGDYLVRLEHTLLTLETSATAHEPCGFVLERFHLSYYALRPDWTLYAEVDRRLRELSCLVILLSLPPSAMAQRCLDREDRKRTRWSEEMVALYGSREAALDAALESQRRRREAASLTCLELEELDTSLEDWDGYADAVVGLWRRKA